MTDTSLFGMRPGPPGAVPPQRVTVRSDPAGTPGFADAVLGPVASGQRWRIERIVVSCPNLWPASVANSVFLPPTLAPSTVAVYAGEAQPNNYLDGTDSGNLDVAEYDFPLIVNEGEVLRVRWTGVAFGVVGIAVVQYHVEPA